METIENFLAVIGLLSLLLTVLRVFWVLFGAGTEWIDNIAVTELPYGDNAEELSLGDGVYPQYFKGGTPTEYTTATLIAPQSTVIRNMKIKRVTDASIQKGRLRYRTVKTVKTVTPQAPLCILCERREAIAEYRVEWRIDYGGKAVYELYDNLRDGDNSCKGIQYTFGFLSKLRKLLELK